MKLSVKFNGHELNEYIEVTKLTRSIGPNRTNSLQKLGMTHGEHYLGYSKGAAIHEMKFAIISDLPEKKRELAGILDVNEPSELIFGDEPDKYMLAIPDSDVDFDDEKFYGNGTINWVVPEGYAHSVSESVYTATPNADGILTMQIANNGTETAEMSFEATMTDDNGYLGAVGPLGAMEFGNIAEVDGYMDLSEWVFRYQMYPSDESAFGKNNGIINWKTSNGGDSNKQQGSFKWLGEIASVTDFGATQTNSSWYGPSLNLSIPAKTSDGKRTGNWKARQWFVHKSRGNARKLGRQEINLSSGSDSIFTFVIYDDSVTASNTKIEFWLFGKKIKNISLDKVWAEFYGSLDIWKENNTIYFKFYHFDSKQTMNFEFTDERISESTLDKWTYWASKYRNNQTCDMSVNFFDFQWIGTQSFVDVPNRYMAGDILSFDGTTGKFYVNRGESNDLAMEDIILGSTDLKIPPGNWIVNFFYSDFSETPPVIKGILRERWL